MSAPRWRVGTKVPRNIYHDDKMVAVAVGDASTSARVARRIVDALNKEDA